MRVDPIPFPKWRRISCRTIVDFSRLSPIIHGQILCSLSQGTYNYITYTVDIFLFLYSLLNSKLRSRLGLAPFQSNFSLAPSPFVFVPVVNYLPIRWKITSLFPMLLGEKLLERTKNGVRRRRWKGIRNEPFRNCTPPGESESINNVELQYLSTDISLNSPMNGEESGKLRNSLLRCYENETYFEREGKRILPISLLVRSNQYKFGQKQRSINWINIKESRGTKYQIIIVN